MDSLINQKSRITRQARQTLDRLNHERRNANADRLTVVRYMERLAAQNPFDRGMRWAADVARRAFEREMRHG